MTPPTTDQPARVAGFLVPGADFFAGICWRRVRELRGIAHETVKEVSTE